MPGGPHAAHTSGQEQRGDVEPACGCPGDVEDTGDHGGGQGEEQPGEGPARHGGGYGGREPGGIRTLGRSRIGPPFGRGTVSERYHTATARSRKTQVRTEKT
ncbi:hypothetical protein GCM10010300_24580 [Streptomyces olivaceoviridis]|nr:hypothetical protein GCM10010300_24580 [Streptomyces olivaceoviridis]